MGHLHLSFNITSLHATAILHQGLGEVHHPLHHSPLHCSCGFFFFLLLAVRVPRSIPHPLRMYWLSVNAYQMEAGSPSLPTPGQARIQSEQHQVAKEGERWGFALSVKSLGDNAAGGCAETQTWMQRGRLTRQRFAFPRNNINVNAHFLSKKWKFNKATLCLWLEWQLQTSPNTELWSKTVSECTQLKRSNQFNITLSFKLKLRISAANEILFELVNQG